MNPDTRAWFDRNTFPPDPRSVVELAALKATTGTTIAVCLPALDEADTIGGICTIVHDELLGAGLVDELIVIDSGSTDETAAIAEASGARVLRAAELMPEAGRPEVAGKGESLWKSLSVVAGDVIVWLDSDTRNFDTRFVTGLVAPLLDDPALGFVKAFYERPLERDELRLPAEGGRVTEIAIRPLLNLFFPQLTGVIQPLSGECAGRVSMLREVPFFTGYAVDVGLLIDFAERFGLEAMAQSDLGVRVHRNRDVAALGRMSFEIIRALMQRLDDDALVKLSNPLPEVLTQFVSERDGVRPDRVPLPVVERPPLSTYLG